MKLITLEEAKARVTIPDLWQRYGLTGEPSKSCRCPWREDNKPSFSVTPDGTLWNDFAAGEGGDAIDFLARLCQLDRRTACRTFLDIAGGMRFLPVRVVKTTAPDKEAPTLPRMEGGTKPELKALATLRSIGREGLDWASERGLLRFADLKGHRSWIVTDAESVNAQARRLDGRPWEHLQGAKAWTLPGSWASWPLGIREAAAFPTIALCEGGPDFLAAHYLSLWEQATHHSKQDAQCAPVAMLGASQRIHEKALPLFAGKRVRIFCHADEAGHRAARVWAEQFVSVEVTADAFDFTGLRKSNGAPVKDLNDFLDLSADDYHTHPGFWRVLP